MESCQKSVQKYCAILIFLLIFSGFIQGQTGTWLPESKQKEYQGFLPKLEFNELDGLKFFDHPQAFQLNGGLVSIKVNPAANPDPFGNANRDFPWVTTSGLHQTKPGSVFVLKMAKIPGPIKWYQGINPNRNNTYFQNEPAPIVWEYPEGTRFAEILLKVDSQGFGRAFEVRTRTRQANDKAGLPIWTPEIYRPFQTVEDLPPVDGVPAKYVYKSVTKHVVGHKVDANVEMINLPTRLNSGLLSRVFRPSKLIVTTTVDDNIVPVNFLGNITTCTSCHNQTQKHSRQIDPVREWYGNVRGSDQIFSFSIFDNSSISYSGAPIPLRFRNDLQIVPR